MMAVFCPSDALGVHDLPLVAGMPTAVPKWELASKHHAAYVEPRPPCVPAPCTLAYLRRVWGCLPPSACMRGCDKLLAGGSTELVLASAFPLS